jgi:hypothetical protein
MKRIPTVLGTAIALTLLAGCVGGGAYDPYYGGGYSGTRSDGYGYRQPYPYTGYYRYNNDERRNSNAYYSRDPYYYDGRNYYRR